MGTSLQRILILHGNLPEACGQRPLGEGASVVELQESILYYHRSAEHCHADVVNGRGTVEAVQFLGLCMALHELPSNFVRSSSSSSQERTKYIQLDSSTLVFVPLERNFGADLLAIIQVARGGGNPFAIQQSLEDHHALFCLLRGGGIMKRLAESLTKMGELYKLLKLIRKAQATLDRGGAPRTSQSDDSTTAGDDLAKYKRDVKALRRVLPMSAIRRDLDAHYQDYVDHHGLVQSRNGGAGRCIVETIPKPIALLSASHTQMSSVLVLTSSRLQALESATRHILDDRSSNILLGISTFCHGQFLHAHWSTPDMISHLASLEENSSTPPVKVEVPDDQVRQIMRYMASYNMKMSLLPTQESLSSSTPGSTYKLGIQNILPSYNHQHKSTITTLGMYNSGHFLPPPPPFMLNAIDGAPSYLQLSLQDKAWIIPVHLSIHVTNVSGISSDKEQQIAAWVMMYQAQDYSFLLFFGDGCLIEETSISLFSTVQLRLNDLVTQSVLENSTVAQQSLLDWKEPGQDVIVVDRRKNHLYLFSDRAHRRPKYSNTVTKNSRSLVARSFLGLPMPRVVKKATSSKTEARPKHDALEWAALGLDCRHFLASHLPLDILLALDDMMNELALRRRQHQQQQQRLQSDGMHLECATTMVGRSSLLELCTCMPLGWVYACSTVHDEKEVYAFFDSSVYVTVSDVQSASVKIQEIFLGEHESTVH